MLAAWVASWQTDKSAKRILLATGAVALMLIVGVN
jgi:hypothetical protein